MHKISHRTCRKQGQKGYILLLLVFFMAVLLLTAMEVAPNVLTNGRREKEKEMIWRGEQYTRAVRLYYAKYRKFPTSVDDLIKPKAGNLRFLRKAYKDPMNTQDGTWRLIYVGPAGQLIGSTKQRPITALIPPGTGVQSTNPTAGMNTNAPVNLGSGSPGGSEISTSGGASPDRNSSTGEGTSAATGPVDGATVFGGNIIGVGSKINQKSVIVYEQAKNYRQFEFVWDSSNQPVGLGHGIPITAPGEQTNLPNNGGASGNGVPAPQNTQ